MSNKKIGLALGGGVVLGAAHVGVLRALEEREIEIESISGTSIGALIAALYSFGKTCDEIEEIAVNLNWLDVAGISVSKYGLLSNKKIKKVLLDQIDDDDFEKANIPLFIVATDITQGTKVVLEKGSVTEAVMASTAIPGVFSPVEMNGHFMVDGGIVENVPISPLIEHGAKTVIGVDLNTSRPKKKPKNIIEVLVNSFHFSFAATSRLQAKDADLIIGPDLSEYSIFDSSQTKGLIKVGYNEASKKLDAFLKDN